MTPLEIASTAFTANNKLTKYIKPTTPYEARDEASQHDPYTTARS